MFIKNIAFLGGLYIKFNLRYTLVLLISVAVIFSSSGCAGSAGSLVKASDKTNKLFESGKMVHLKQVVEHTDSNSQTVVQYFETWLARDKAMSIELDSDGNDLRVGLDTGRKHISYDAQSLEAGRFECSQIQSINLSNIKSSYYRITLIEEKDYAGQNCKVYLMENGENDDWIRIYIDEETGCVLFCDAPFLRIRTAEVEVLETDDSLFSAPSDLIYN